MLNQAFFCTRFCDEVVRLGDSHRPFLPNQNRLLAQYDSELVLNVIAQWHY